MAAVYPAGPLPIIKHFIGSIVFSFVMIANIYNQFQKRKEIFFFFRVTFFLMLLLTYKKQNNKNVTIMRKSVLFLAASAIMMCVSALKSNAQDLIGLPYDKTHTINRKPVPNQYEREADVMWTKIVWRRVELAERANQHLYFPTQPQDGRMSLIDVLLEGIHSQGLTAYQENGNNEFATILTEKEVNAQMGAKQELLVRPNLDGGMDTLLVPVNYNSSEVKSYLVKEVWGVNKQTSAMEVRIIGICPIRTFYRNEDVDQAEPLLKQCFWVYYPEVRSVLASAECFNIKNDAGRLSFDDIFQKRLFSSYVYAESNIHDNRTISEYARGEERLQESERISTGMFNYEQDIWEY